MLKTHLLDTVPSIIRVVDEKNLDFFLADFRQFLLFCIRTKKDFGLSRSLFSFPHMLWTDDSKVGFKQIKVIFKK